MATSMISQTTLTQTQLLMNQVMDHQTPLTLFTTVANHPGSYPMTRLIHHTNMNPSVPMEVVDTPIVTIPLLITFTPIQKIPTAHLPVTPTSTNLILLLSTLVRMALMTHTSLRILMSTTINMEKFLTLTLIMRLTALRMTTHTATPSIATMTSTALPSTVATVATPSTVARVTSAPFMTMMPAATPRVILLTLTSTLVTTTPTTVITTNPKIVTPVTTEQPDKLEWS